MERFNIVVGGGKFGTKAVEYLLKHSKPFIVVDKKEKCHVTEKFSLLRLNLDGIDRINFSQNYFIKGE